MSKMNKKELFDYCKNQRSQIQSHQMDVNEFKEIISQMKLDFESNGIHTDNEIKKLKEKNKDLESGNLCMEEENDKLTGMIDWDLIKDNKKLQSDIQELQTSSIKTKSNNKILKSKLERILDENKTLKEEDWDKKYALKIDYQRILDENKYLKENLEFNNNYKTSCEKRIKELESKLYKS
tara:strand:+ start:120 stop:659 length:540 start_codon:yes stop_codon:yes gene_type:complete